MRRIVVVIALTMSIAGLAILVIADQVGQSRAEYRHRVCGQAEIVPLGNDFLCVQDGRVTGWGR